MRKQIYLVLALFLTSFAFAQEVKLTHSMPAAAAPGETINVEFVVTKGNIGAFAKFQSDLPAGYQAVAGDTKSGNFTFENNRVKIVWVSLPGDASFAFSFKVTIPASASGSATIAGQFYYLENNVKKEFDVPPHTISLGGSGTVAATTTPVETTSTPAATTTTPTETTSTPVATTTTTPSETTTTPVATTSTPTETKTAPVETTSTPVETKTTPVETKTTPAETKTTPVAKTTAPAVKSGVVYYIQVAALSSDPGGQFKKYGKTKVVQEGGMYKVLAGSYNSLEEARKHKPDMAGKGADGCFVVGYENGVRIKL